MENELNGTPAPQTIESEIAASQTTLSALDIRLTALEEQVATLCDKSPITTQIAAMTDLLDKHGIRAD